MSLATLSNEADDERQGNYSAIIWPCPMNLTYDGNCTVFQEMNFKNLKNSRFFRILPNIIFNIF